MLLPGPGAARAAAPFDCTDQAVVPARNGVPQPAGNIAALSGPSQSSRALGMTRAHILNGTFAPGEKVSELKLCDLLGLSRTPIRAALRQLEFEGLLMQRDDGGFVVRAFSVADVEDLVETRATLEGLAAHRALLRGVSAEQLVQARELLMCLDAILSRPQLDACAVQAYAERNRAFHMLLGEMSGSEVIRRQLRQLTSSPFGDPSAFVHARARMPAAHLAFLTAQEQHRQFVEALASRDTRRAEAVLTEHARSGRRALSHAVDTRRTDLLLGGGLIVRPTLAPRLPDA
ncbi:GntR family transcriptional regulator [Aquabacterium sp.]|uniref:GntR family transcriptional regulator n=1 Tax=Aquabacterium sp. TaxID=1872578 RepID=UPI0035B443B6